MTSTVAIGSAVLPAASTRRTAALGQLELRSISFCAHHVGARELFDQIKVRMPTTLWWQFPVCYRKGVASSIHRAASFCGTLGFVVVGGCSVYDRSLAVAAAHDSGEDIEASDAPSIPDSTDDADFDDTVDDDAVDASSLFDQVSPDEEVEGSRDASTGPADARLDVADTNANDVGADASRPRGITFVGMPLPSGQRAPTTSGSAFSQTCAANEVVIGYTGTLDGPDAAVPVLRTFRAVCGRLSVTSGQPFAVTTASAELLPVVGTNAGPVAQVQMCAKDEMVVGFGGRSGADIDQIVILCAPLNVSVADGRFALSIGNTNARAGLGGQGGATFAVIPCPDGMVAVGNEGRAAYTINAFGLLCAAPVLVVQ